MADTQEIQRILGAPVFADLTENALRIRRNLLVTSVITLFIYYASIKIKEDSAFLGLHFEGLTNIKIEIGLLILLLYFLIHFLWFVWDSIYEWRLRITGMSKLSSVLVEGGDVGDDLRNSTLYNWWRLQSEDIRLAKLKLEQLEFPINLLKEVVEGDKVRLEPYQLNTQLNDILIKLNSIQQYMKRVVTVMEHQRFHYSLERFDKWYRHFLTSQNMRWLFIEVLLPIGLGLWAIGVAGFELHQFNDIIK